MDYRKKARDLANLLGHTSVDYHNKSIAIDFITEALKETVNEVNTLNIARVVLPTDKKATLCDHDWHTHTMPKQCKKCPVIRYE